MAFESKKGYKRTLQGMEHLQQHVSESTHSSTFDSQDQSDGVQSRDSVLKKELTSVIVLMSILFMVLVAIMVLDKSGDYLSIYSEKLTNFFTN